MTDPPEHFIVSANNRPAPAGYLHLIGLEFPELYRAQRIRDLLTADSSPRKFTSDDFARFQADTLSLHARALPPLLLPRAHPARSRSPGARGRAALEPGRARRARPRRSSRPGLQLAPAFVGDRLRPDASRTIRGVSAS